MSMRWWHEGEKIPEDITAYHRRMYDNGNITICMSGEFVLGYIEVWRVNFEQWGRLVCHAPFDIYEENITDGNIAIVSNMFIRPEFRNGKVYKKLRNDFFKQNSHCDYYVGEALRKKSQPIKVFKRENLSSKLFKTGEK